MQAIKDFNLIDSPLEGSNLIEASAGTGKTYAITGLFLSLILEKNLPANEILVVTFTEAATDELKDRIRIRLREAIEAFSTGQGRDKFLNGLIGKIDRVKALRSLNEALRIFDESCIYTIHGFCRKMLREYAFESGSLFDTELVTDQEGLKKEVVEDFWRMHFYHESPLFVNYAVHRKTSPGNLLSIFAGKAVGLDLKIIPAPENPDSSVEELQFKEAFEEMRRAWPAAKEAVEQIFVTDKGLNRTKYGKKIPVWIQRMEDLAASGGNNPILFDGFSKFCSSEIEGAVKKNHTAPEHPFFHICETLRDTCEELADVFEKRLLGLKIKLFHFLQGELDLRKKRKNIQFFDDLLLRLYRALEGKGGKDLARGIREKFKAALIDEFQDTDPIQYAIFKNIFNAKKSGLFLIGDPKQAIYGFRGADIFAYMDAAAHARNRYTLNENWRSEPGLITAVNAVFENASPPFVYEQIPYHRVRPPAEKKDFELLEIKGVLSESPMQLWFLDAGKITGSAKALNKSTARLRIAGAVAAEISRLLSLAAARKAMLGDRPLQEMDIAVLVRQNTEAHIMQQALSELKVPSVLYTTDNLFVSHEALEMERVLAGIVQPDKERALKSSLTTDMIGVSGEHIDRIIENEGEWEKWLVRFREYHTLWNRHGFMRMFKSMALEEKALPRLMSFPDGERRSTNLLHLSEVLHQASVEKKLGMTGLLKWLSEKRDTETQTADEHQLRLESDENAVRLVTIHRSKGLEYPVVFCPFVWGGSRSRDRNGPFMFHDESENMKLTFDMGSEALDENRVLAEKEMLAENLRLMYVAMTRAKNRCYLVWGRFNKADTSAPAYLLHPPDSDGRDNILDATSARFNSLSDPGIYAELETLCGKAEGAIRLSEMPEKAGVDYSPQSGLQEKLRFQRFKGHIDQGFRISSFSSLISNQPNRAEIADHDGEIGADGYDQRESEGLIDREEPAGIFAFPKGAGPGTFMHDILEHLDFTRKDDAHMKELVETKLLEYGFETLWNQTICDMLRNVLSVPLEPDQKDFTFSGIPNTERLNELGFYFPLKSITPEKLKRLFERMPIAELSSDFPERMGKLNFSPVSGFMKGFMDMVFQFQNRFYLVDWKSNYLGSRVEDYSPEALGMAMEEDLYILQYHIYTVALHQYLKVRLSDYSYEKHFGGVYYIFLRGVKPDMGPEFGVYRDRPPAELITELCSGLIDI